MEGEETERGTAAALVLFSDVEVAVLDGCLQVGITIEASPRFGLWRSVTSGAPHDYLLEITSVYCSKEGQALDFIDSFISS